LKPLDPTHVPARRIRKPLFGRATDRVFHRDLSGVATMLSILRQVSLIRYFSMTRQIADRKRMFPRIAAHYRFLRERSLLGTAVSWAMIVATMWVVPAAMWKGDWPLAVMAAIAVTASLLPAILRRNYRIVFPWFLGFLLVLQLHLHTFWGVWLRFYDSQWFWDKLLHLTGTMLVSFVGFLAAYSLHLSGKVRLTGPIMGLFTVVFGNALGAWWEIVEYLVDKTLQKNTQYGLDNTMIDLINNFFGSLIAAGLGWVYLKVTPRKERHQLDEPLAPAIAPLDSADLRVSGEAITKHAMNLRTEPTSGSG